MKNKRLENIKSTASEVFELPKEIVLNLPKISITGNNQMLVENHKGIIEYTSERMRIRTAIGVIKIEGSNMILKNIAPEDMIISGKIKIVEFGL